LITLFLMWRGYEKAAADKARIDEIGAMTAGSEEQRAALRDAFGTVDSDEQRLRIIRNLVHLRDPDAGDLYVRALDHEGGIRRYAAIGLARLGPPAPNGATDKLLAVLPTSGIIDRTAVTWALAVFGEGRAAEEILEDFAAGKFQEDDDIKDMFDAHIIA